MEKKEPISEVLKMIRIDLEGAMEAQEADPECETYEYPVDWEAEKHG